MNLKNATVSSVSTLKDRSVKIVLNTRELPVDELAMLFHSVNNEIASVELPEDSGDTKSPSQRLRWVLYKVFDTNSEVQEKFKTFALYYNHIMEQLINLYKEKIIEK